MQKPSLASAADSVLAEGIALNKFVTTVYGTGRGNGARHRATPSVLVRGMHRALEESFTPHSAALGDGCALDMWRTRQQQSSATAAQSASTLYSTTAGSCEIGTRAPPRASFDGRPWNCGVQRDWRVQKARGANESKYAVSEEAYRVICS